MKIPKPSAIPGGDWKAYLRSLGGQRPMDLETMLTGLHKKGFKLEVHHLEKVAEIQKGLQGRGKTEPFFSEKLETLRRREAAGIQTEIFLRRLDHG